MMDLKKAEEYFGSINTIASRIYDEINQTKAGYEDLWNTLSTSEQEQIVNESIIKPEVQIQYQSQESERCKDNKEYSVKLIIDENNCTYRDEHSAPFTFKTKSQRDLTIFSTPNENKMKKPPRMLNKPKAKLPSMSVETPIVEITKEEDIKAELTNSTGSLPKTGLDFLDNW